MRIGPATLLFPTSLDDAVDHLGRSLLAASRWLAERYRPKDYFEPLLTVEGPDSALAGLSAPIIEPARSRL